MAKLPQSVRREPSLDFSQANVIKRTLLPLLKQEFQDVSVKALGELGRGSHSVVYGLELDKQNFVLKVCFDNDYFIKETTALAKLTWLEPPAAIIDRAKSGLDLDLILTKRPDGHVMSSADLTSKVQKQLGDALLKVHSHKQPGTVDTNKLLERFEEYSGPATAIVRRIRPEISEDLERALKKAKAYFIANQKDFAVQPSMLHGDLWWGNIIATPSEVFLIDWELGDGDYLEDLAKLRQMFDYSHVPDGLRSFWRGERRPRLVDDFFEGLLEQYIQFDTDIMKRAPFYVLLYGIWRLRAMEIQNSKRDLENRVGWYVQDCLKFSA
ncbi:MAG TPA: aminoglycoside phosphotransferase family protein [Candidatus Saccharimonadales bacterium]|nr:aminoglycoside phosphotransferase family protein [Candidatus Saccharimonadales bacterium]